MSNLAAGALAGAIGARGAIAVFSLLAIAASATYFVLTRPVRAALAREESGLEPLSASPAT